MMIKKVFFVISFLLYLLPDTVKANPLVSGISANEINIDTKFRGEEILLFGAKADAGNIIIAIRGPKKNFLVTKKENFLGIWYNGERIKFKDSYSFYAIFSTFKDRTNNHQIFDRLLTELELGKDNLRFNVSDEVDPQKKNEFQSQLTDQLEKNQLYSTNLDRIEFLDETLFKVGLNFPKNISRGVYVVEIYLVNDGSLSSFQSIPIYINQVGLSAKILDFANQQPFLYGMLAVAIALVVGWLTNYFFVRFIGK